MRNLSQYFVHYDERTSAFLCPDTFGLTCLRHTFIIGNDHKKIGLRSLPNYNGTQTKNNKGEVGALRRLLKKMPSDGRAVKKGAYYMEAFLQFFSEQGGEQMPLFGPLHLILTLIVVAAVLLMYHFRAALRAMQHKTKKMFANMTIYYGGLMLCGEYSIKRHLPLEFCFITGYLLMYILVTNSRKLYRIVFYYTIIGPLPAMIWPNVSGVGTRYVFSQFIISHHFMILVSFYLMIAMRYHVYARDTVPALVAGNIVFTAVYILNINWGSNYIMSAGLPAHMLKMYPFLRYFNHPFFWLEVCGVAFLAIGVLISWLLQGRPKMKRIRPAIPKAGLHSA